MNIKHNRFVLFVGPIIWALVAMSAPKTIEAGIYTLWFVMATVYDICEISHHKIYSYSPQRVGEWRQYALMEAILTCWCTAMGFPALSVLGIILIKILKNPTKIGVILGCIWSVYYISYMWVDWGWIFGCYPKWFGIIIPIWAFVHYGMIVEIESFGESRLNALKQYQMTWFLRFIEQLLLSSLRWFTWCECVFPYRQRHDVWFYGFAITIFCMWIVNHKRPQKLLKFTHKFDNFHMPAPCEETAALCNICKDKQYAMDVEQGMAEGGFTLFEKEQRVVL